MLNSVHTSELKKSRRINIVVGTALLVVALAGCSNVSPRQTSKTDCVALTGKFVDPSIEKLSIPLGCSATGSVDIAKTLKEMKWHLERKDYSCLEIDVCANNIEQATLAEIYRWERECSRTSTPHQFRLSDATNGAGGSEEIRFFSGLRQPIVITIENWDLLSVKTGRYAESSQKVSLQGILDIILKRQQEGVCACLIMINKNALAGSGGTSLLSLLHTLNADPRRSYYQIWLCS